MLSFNAGRVLAEEYALDAVTLRPLAGAVDQARVVYYVQDAQDRTWVARAYSDAAPLPDHLRGCGVTTARDFLETRARTLVFLQRQAYPAPRVLHTRTGVLVAGAHGWRCLVTTYVHGAQPEPTVEALRALGTAVGRLHALAGANESSVGLSYWPPRRAVPDTLAHLHSVAELIPPRWREMHAAYCRTLETLLHGPTLPATLIHGDAWLGNAVADGRGELVLVDWDEAGLGVAVLDLGRLLLSAHWGLDGPPPELEPAPERITAVLTGYCQARVPARAERAVLVEAIRYGVVFVAANHFGRLRGEGWSEALEAFIRRLGAWYTACTEIRHLAQTHLDTLAD